LLNLSLGEVSLAILGFLLIGLMVMDWQTHLLPDAFTVTGLLISFLLACVRAFFLGPQEEQIVLNSTKQLRLRSPGSFAAQGNVFLTGPEHLLGVWLLSVVGAAAILLLIRWGYKALRHREGMGLGDVKLLAMIAGFLGFWPALLALFLSTLAATAYALVLVARGRAGAATALPFGSFLCAGGLVTALFGGPVIAFYGSLFR
jgi:leader peptidase (prepilin peptidase)/N-methyltransferase